MSLKVYDYVCTKCGNTEERYVTFDDREDQLCGHKGCQYAMIRQMSAPQTTFKHHDRKSFKS